MTQGFTHPVLKDPFSIPRAVHPVQSDKKRVNSLIMKGLRGFASESVLQINVSGGFTGTFLVNIILTLTLGFEAPGTASGGLSSVFIGTVPVLGLPFPNSVRAK